MIRVLKIFLCIVYRFFQDFKGAMLDANQKLLFSQLVLDNKGILMGALGPGVTNKLRDKKWQEITSLLIANGASSELSATYVRHTEWGNLSRSVVDKFRKHLRSGAEGKLPL